MRTEHAPRPLGTDMVGTADRAARRGARRRGAIAVAATIALTVINPWAVPGPAQAATPAAAKPAPTAAAKSVTDWTTRTVAPGIELRTGVIKDPDAKPSWTVTIQAPAVNRLTGAPTSAPLSTRAWADDTARRLRDAGLEPRLEQVRWPAYADTPSGTMGWRVRVGSYATAEGAQSTSQKVSASGLRPAVEWTGYDVQQPADRESVHVAVIDPAAFTGTVESTHNGDVADRETTSSVAAKVGSLIGVNGGFFITSDADGVQGTMAGIGAYDGELQSMAAGSRAALILDDGGRRPRIADLTTTVTARAGSAGYAVEGINRVPGKVRNCGRPGATPTELPRQDLTCAKTDDLVKFTSSFRADLPTGPGVQAVLDADHRVVSVGARGGKVPSGGSVLQGIGGAADWLTAHGRAGEPISVEEVIRDTAGRQVELGPDDSVVSAAPTLVEDGRNAVDAATEGMLDPQDLSFGYAWSNGRQPRTMAGIDKQGRLILATVDGRQPGVSEGFTLVEGADFMRSLGAEQALNLDGGGSSAMAVNGGLVNAPSDVAGERAVGDTVQVVPAGAGR
ncbi:MULTISPECIES: phosphodiester glycosidase family protein [Streptomyces]|uniref:Phosphodiester glycosidase family protein n=1 Tax=Streptomyces lonegramiae TaxID=3075524 RepID=A0ABU2XB92_9ACTN|nr:phosphodiester glycosidase family protein [Streptomyces sp. DSM 41529]MDT0543181.1 phosphodiester glycosidase family protein [Streptomyces sp. DSM 41529]